LEFGFFRPEPEPHELITGMAVNAAAAVAAVPRNLRLLIVFFFILFCLGL
jgi:hypothetical protein